MSSLTPSPQDMALLHKTVLLDEAVEALLAGLSHQQKVADTVLVDATFGRGGHSRKILSQLAAHPGVRLLAFDKDPQAIAAGMNLVGAQGNAQFGLVHASYAEAAKILQEQGTKNLAGVLMDLGISSPQIDVAERGFSFRLDGPLDMRMDTTQGVTAAEWLKEVDESTLREVIRDYGEERHAFQIAKAIVTRRDDASRGPLSTTRELAQVVASAVKTSWRDKGQDPATRTFQAIRIFINRELAELQIALNALLPLLAPGARLVVISFHSLEDRLVKRFMQFHAHGPEVDRRIPVRAADLPQPLLKLLGKVVPSAAEVTANPRSRSAVMRVAERTAEPLNNWYPNNQVIWPAPAQSAGPHSKVSSKEGKPWAA